MYRRALLSFFFVAFLCHPPSVPAEPVTKWLSQEIYVPLYSHIYGDDRYKDRVFQLTGILFIRNTDPKKSMSVTAVDYYDSSGKLLRSFTDQIVSIGPLGSERYIIPEGDRKGGSGAKFIVRWKSEHAITEPIVESVMIGTQMQQGISFVSRGRVISGEIKE